MESNDIPVEGEDDEEERCAIAETGKREDNEEGRGG